jgi:hypothetical protein
MNSGGYGSTRELNTRRLPSDLLLLLFNPPTFFKDVHDVDDAPVGVLVDSGGTGVALERRSLLLWCGRLM